MTPQPGLRQSVPHRRTFRGRGQRVMANTVFVLTIFPFFHVVPALSSDVQPIAGVLAFAVWALGGKRSGLAALLSPLICVLGLYVIIAIAFVEFGAAPSEIARLAEAIA